MKLTRKMIPAFAMLLVSAVLMSTASFAWFSMNGNVQVTGFSVEATAPAALWVSQTGDVGTYKDTLTMMDREDDTKPLPTKTIAPVTNKFTDATNLATNAASWTFQSLTPDAYKEVKDNGKVNNAAVTQDDLTNDTTNFYKEYFYLLLEGQRDAAGVEQKTVTATITVNGTPTNASTEIVWKSLRIALVTAGGSKTDGLTKSTAGKAIFTPTALGTATAAQTITTIAAQDAVQVYVYIWFEGEDQFNYNRAAQFMDDYSFTIDFAAAAHTHDYGTGTSCTVCGAAKPTT